MSKPNSLTTKFRWWLSDKIQPCPDHGEGWCIDCSITNGITTVLSADGIQMHVEKHSELGDPNSLRIVAKWR